MTNSNAILAERDVCEFLADSHRGENPRLVVNIKADGTVLGKWVFGTSHGVADPLLADPLLEVGGSGVSVISLEHVRAANFYRQLMDLLGGIDSEAILAELASNMRAE